MKLRLEQLKLVARALIFYASSERCPEAERVTVLETLQELVAKNPEVI